jgi:Holliday junction DNA helicase RuvA
VYDFLEGELIEHRATHVVVAAGGVGYELAVPLGAEFAARDGRVHVWTHLVVREDAHLLFGFPERRVREVFRLLLGVSGVGPAVALALLSNLQAGELLKAIAEQDESALRRAKGVGKKTAEQILLDLREKAPRMLAESARDTRDTLVPRASPERRSLEDAVRALVSIGYSDKEARKSVERAASKVPGDDLELLVRTALQQ